MKAHTENDLYRACEILFGPDIDLSRDFLFYIQPSGVKSAYRKRALLTHPDMNVSLDTKGRKLTTRMFVETNWAYEHLIDFIKDREQRRTAFGIRTPRPRPARRPYRQRTGAKSGGTGNFYRSTVPKRRLLFGQYLFFTGSVSWEALVKAIVWQRRERPRLGDIAKDRGWLNDAKLRRIIQQRKFGEPLGEAAVRLKHMKRTQLYSILNLQRRGQSPIGEYFVQNNHLSSARLRDLYAEYQRHNLRYRGYTWERNTSI